MKAILIKIKSSSKKEDKRGSETPSDNKLISTNESKSFKKMDITESI